MDICTNLSNIKYFKESILTIGVFDGMHLGHKTIIKQTSKIAASNGLPSVVITFDPYPKEILTKDNNQSLLMDKNDKLKILDSHDINYVLNIPFSKEFSNISAKVFLKELIIKYFNPTDIIIGYDHRFGYEQKGDIKFLQKYAITYNYNIHSIKPLRINNDVVSSTNIRKFLKNNNIELANMSLGYNYFFYGIVKKGDGRGQKINFPTANIIPINNNQVIPKKGVYCVDVEINNISYVGMCNVGYRPTFYNNGVKTIEVHLITKENISIRNKLIKIIFKEYIRDEKKYKNVDELINQLNEDRYLCQSN